jgi:hypothetical protein
MLRPQRVYYREMGQEMKKKKKTHESTIVIFKHKCQTTAGFSPEKWLDPKDRVALARSKSN